MICDLQDVPPEQLEQLCHRLGERPYRARQIRDGLYRRMVLKIDEMSDLPKSLRQRLAEDYPILGPEIRQQQISTDGTCKFLLQFHDGARIETVAIPEADHWTLCLSTQVGCAIGCLFCATGTLGLIRNLSTSEILSQAKLVMRELALTGRINIVLMGMGEPLHNFAAVVQAVRTLVSPLGFDWSQRRINLSTVGLVPEIDRLGAADTGVQLSISLNAANDDLRSHIMPVNRRYPLAELMAACRRYPLKPGRRITFEYVMLHGVNDEDEHARQLIRLLHGLKAKINLIPFNPIPGVPFQSCPPARIEHFRHLLVTANLSVFIRASKGSDIAGACGQLSARNRMKF